MLRIDDNLSAVLRVAASYNDRWASVRSGVAKLADSLSKLVVRSYAPKRRAVLWTSAALLAGGILYAAVTLDGLLGGKPLSLSYAQVSPNHRVSLAYSFKYFQEYNEPVDLPAGFEPTRLGVEIHSGRDANHSFRQAFVWKAQGMSVETEANGDIPGKGEADVQTETE